MFAENESDIPAYADKKCEAQRPCRSKRYGSDMKRGDGKGETCKAGKAVGQCRCRNLPAESWMEHGGKA
jgi:hypothetical protein